MTKNRHKKIKRFNNNIQRRKSRHVNVLEKKLKNKINKPKNAYHNVLSKPILKVKTVRYQKKMVDKYMDKIFVKNHNHTPVVKNRFSYELTKINDDANIIKKRLICEKRKEKRRNIFRTGRAGKGVAGPIKKVLKPESYERC